MHEDHQDLSLPVTGRRPSGKGLRSLLVPGLLAAASVGIGGPAGAARPLPAETAQSAAKAASSLAVGEPLSGRLAPGQVLSLQLQAPAGAVVRGNLQALGVVLDVQTPDGRHLRRLSQGAGVDHAFTWQSRGMAKERLVLRAEKVQPYVSAANGMSAVQDGHSGAPAYAAPSPGAYELTITQVLAPLAADHAPAPEIEPEPLRSPRLKALQAWLAQGGDSRGFWQEMEREGTPLIEPWDAEHQLVSFVWRGAGQSVRLFGSPSGNHEPLQRLGSSDVWWGSFVMPRDARLSYGFAPDVPAVSADAMIQRRSILSTLQRDPLNRQSWGRSADLQAVQDRYDGRSVLTLAKAPPQPWSQSRASVATGQLQRHWLDSQALGNGRDIWIYKPQGWQQADAAQRSLLVLFDAQAYLRQVPTPAIIDNLMADGLLPATAVVLVANGAGDARSRELPPNPVFADFMGKQLMPWLKAQGIAAGAERTVIAGSSYGGLASSYVALRYPQWFGNVLSLSGSYWWAPKGEPPNWLARQYEQAPQLPIRFYFDAGLYEGARGGQAGIRETSQELGDVLRAKGNKVVQRVHSTGHDYVHWQGSLACGLLALTGREPSTEALKEQVVQACGL
ncbi:esterase [Comamonas thiooxydans]|uniref:enterochelin esterase domain-containing protein n=1 Tax=Comamonas thiooxydans TaxID=363952 RepID=UPI0007C4C5EA|nr:enterochelin esterase domain-containing protein [Comamonas thiooxydans]OAD85960.1 esterase [Comamonas thiooxydans]